MADGERLGASFSIDVTDLKAGLQQANRLIRESESEFKSAAAGMDDWTKSEEGLKSKIKSLSDITAVQKEKVAALKKEYQNLIDNGLDPTSKEAVELRTKINNEEAALASNEKELKRQQQALDDLGEATDEAGNKTEKFGEIAKKAGEIALKAFAAAGAAVVAIGKSALDSYADYEQLVGGVDTLFGESSATVQEYAQNAYKTAGMSANEYMETVTGFSASLLQSLDGDTAKAAKVADMAISDMSDNANKMGSDIESIQNAYGGFAKGNFTMLDNLKLGYGGTKEEMQRLLSDAEKLSGVKYDLSSYADITEAIHVVQNEMGITGTTAKEAASTISGSVSSMKGAWSNLLTGIADENADVDGLIENLIDSVTTVIGNILPRVKVIVDGILKMIKALLPQIPPLINEILPDLIDGASGIITGIIEVLPALIDGIVAVLPQIVTAILNMLPLLLNAAINIITALISGISGMLPTIISAIMEILPQLINELVASIPDLLNAAVQLLMAIVDAVPVIINGLLEALPGIIDTIINTVITALPQLLDAAITLLMALIEAIPTIIDALIVNLPKIIDTIITGVVKALPQMLNAAITFFMALIKALPTIINALITNLPRIISTITSTLIKNLPVILSAAVQLFMGIIKAIPQIITQLVKQLPTIIKTIVNSLGEGVKSVSEVGKNLIRGLWNGISDMGKWIGQKIKGFGESILGSLKSFFGIHSPSKVMENVIGKNLALGIGEGFENNIGAVNDEIKSAMQLDDINLNADITGRKKDGVTIYQTNNYSQAHSRLELYKTKQQTAAAVRLALGAV